MSEKLTKIYDFFNESKIELPTDVKNAIEDVFNENDGVEDVDIYFLEDSELFEKDLTLKNEVNAYLNSPSTGSSNNVFTYYGEIDFSLSEFVKLYDGETLLEEITRIDLADKFTKVNESMFAVVLVERLKWEDGKLAKHLKLHIYCPKSSEGEVED
jgi:hypothetical protein